MRPAFTLVELLVVIFIIALLISIFLPALRHVRESSRRTKCQVHLRSYAASLTLYPLDHDDTFANALRYKVPGLDTFVWGTPESLPGFLLSSLEQSYGLNTDEGLVCPSVGDRRTAYTYDYSLMIGMLEPQYDEQYPGPIYVSDEPEAAPAPRRLHLADPANVIATDINHILSRVWNGQLQRRAAGFSNHSLKYFYARQNARNFSESEFAKGLIGSNLARVDGSVAWTDRAASGARGGPPSMTFRGVKATPSKVSPAIRTYWW